MKIDYEITVDVRGMSVKKKRKVQDAFFKLGVSAPVSGECFGVPIANAEFCFSNKNMAGNIINKLMWDCYDHETHTYAQLLELAGMTDKKQLPDLNSDELRTKLAKNTGKMTKLKLQNDEIVELLRSRALAPIDVDDKVALTFDELKAGGWWMANPNQQDGDSLRLKGLKVHNRSNWDKGSWRCCLFCAGKKEITRSDTDVSEMKQIHRIGNEFYWGAP